MFIAFDGIDGSGKSTLSQKVNKYFINNNLKPEVFDMGSFGFIDKHLKKIKNKDVPVDPEIRELLFYFEGNLLSDYVKASNDKIIITDRYFLSYYAYGPINGISQDEVWRLVHTMVFPSFYFFIDITPEVALERIEKYRKIEIAEIGYKNVLSQNEEENKKLYIKAQHKIYSNYMNAITRFASNVHIIDGARDVNQIFDEIESIINIY